MQLLACVATDNRLSFITHGKFILKICEKKSVLCWVDLSKKNITNSLVRQRGLSLLVNVCELSDACKVKNVIKTDFKSFCCTLFCHNRGRIVLVLWLHCERSRSPQKFRPVYSRFFFNIVLLLANTRWRACELHVIVPVPRNKKAVWKKASSKLNNFTMFGITNDLLGVDAAASSVLRKHHEICLELETEWP